MTALAEVEDLTNMEEYKLSEDVIIRTFNFEHILLMMDSIANCSICLKDIKTEDQMARLRCKHTYHMMCVTKWLEVSKTFPLCRYQVDNQQH